MRVSVTRLRDRVMVPVEESMVKKLGAVSTPTME